MRLAAAASFVSCFAVVLGWGNNPDRVLLSEMKTLVLYDGRMTNARRAAAVPQMKCVGGECGAVQIDFMECENKGTSGYNNIQWKCTAFPEMSKEFTLSSVTVGCEGYNDKSDPYVLQGSCGVEYSIKRNANHKASSQQHYGNAHGNPHSYKSASSYNHGSATDYPPYYSYDQSSSSSWRWILFLAIAAILAYFIFFAPPRADQGSRGGGSTGGGGGGFFGGGGGSGPWYGGGGSGGGAGLRNRGAGTYTQQQYPQAPQQQNGGGGGFWGTFLPGAALGYLFGNYNRPRQNMYTNPYSGVGTGYANTFGTQPQYGGGFGGGGFGRGGGGGGSSSSSGGTHSSSAFGGTSNR